MPLVGLLLAVIVAAGCTGPTGKMEVAPAAVRIDRTDHSIADPAASDRTIRIRINAPAAPAEDAELTIIQEAVPSVVGGQ